MSEPTITSDPTYYRVEYSRIAQRLHELTAARDEGPVRVSTQWEDEVIAAALRLVKAEIPFEAQDLDAPISARFPEPISDEPRALIAATRRELVRLGWRWVGRSPPWYIRRLRRVSATDHRLAVFLDEVLEPASVVLYFSCRIAEGAKREIDIHDLSPLPERTLDRRGARAADAVSERWLYERIDGRLVRRILRRDGSSSKLDCGTAPARAIEDRLPEIADKRWLALTVAPELPDVNPMRFADLFCGCGALSLGVQEAARSLGRGAVPVLSADDDPAPLAVYAKSVRSGDDSVRQVDLAAMLDGALGSKETTAERAFLKACPDDLDLVLAEPPCQGYSPLNNHTRHNDERNDLYLRVVRFVELRRPRYCLIENVRTIVRDQRRSAGTAIDRLEKLGYVVDDDVVHLDVLGVPQTRRRHVVVAAADDEEPISVRDVVEAYAVPRVQHRTVGWAIRDLKASTGCSEFDEPSIPSELNLQRMEWLIERDEDDLPNWLRPDCHKLPKMDEDGNGVEHSYKAMYGRLDWKRPAQTITSGFGSMGQGRYVHPDQSRTLTPHEAARLQLLPDWMDFDAATGRGRWARMIGNAAPMKLSYAFALEMFR